MRAKRMNGVVMSASAKQAVSAATHQGLGQCFGCLETH